MTWKFSMSVLRSLLQMFILEFKAFTLIKWIHTCTRNIYLALHIYIIKYHTVNPPCKYQKIDLFHQFLGIIWNRSETFPLSLNWQHEKDSTIFLLNMLCINWVGNISIEYTLVGSPVWRDVFKKVHHVTVTVSLRVITRQRAMSQVSS